MKALAGAIFLSFIAMKSQSQELRDSTELLDEVMVRAYENNRRLIEVPAAVSVVNKVQIERFNNTTLLPAINTNAGVRMEERSPGSYRLNIRGSSLRSPFGVRNVKVYYNDIPYTEPGGNTFFNQLGPYNIGRLEIIKGPGGSLYGAGTGGVILINNDLANIHRGATVDYVRGSYGMNSFHANLRGGQADKLYNSVHYQYQNSDGYRNHTKMERKVLSWDGVAKMSEKGTLRVHFMQGDLFYQTPGALTAQEFNDDPKAARPRVGPTPGSEEAGAAITQKMFFSGLNYSVDWDENLKSSSTVYGAYSQLINPTTRNYERRTEPHFGSRNMLQFNDTVGGTGITAQGGFETQQGFGSSRVYDNVNGGPGNVQTDDVIRNQQAFLFLQGSVDFRSGWLVTAGASYNLIKVRFERLAQPASVLTRDYNNQLAPRVAVMKKLKGNMSAYASVSRGFSPPTTGELLPSTGVINTVLDAERGVNYEAGFKGNLLRAKLYFDVTLFHFGLKNTIAQRRAIDGADYFVNAGKTRQNGVETFASYRLAGKGHHLFDEVKVWAAHTFHDFHYVDFSSVTEDTADFSGNRLPGIPRNFLSAGVDVVMKNGLYANATYYYSDPMPLNDANTDFASSYNLLGARLGFRRPVFGEGMIDIFAAVDNIFDVKYSLGNDINAFGRRYYNAAPGVNYSVGVRLGYNW